MEGSRSPLLTGVPEDLGREETSCVSPIREVLGDWMRRSSMSGEVPRSSMSGEAPRSSMSGEVLISIQVTGVHCSAIRDKQPHRRWSVWDLLATHMTSEVSIDQMKKQNDRISVK